MAFPSTFSIPPDIFYLNNRRRLFFPFVLSYASFFDYYTFKIELNSFLHLNNIFVHFVEFFMLTFLKKIISISICLS